MEDVERAVRTRATLGQRVPAWGRERLLVFLWSEGRSVAALEAQTRSSFRIQYEPDQLHLSLSAVVQWPQPESGRFPGSPCLLGHGGVVAPSLGTRTAAPIIFHNEGWEDP